MKRFIFSLALALVIAGSCQAEPVAIVDRPVSGHVHPSICQTAEGTLLVVFKDGQQLSVSRSADGGATWSEPAAIPTTAKRPESIREVKKFEVYPGTADTLPDGRILVTWNYIADDKATDGYYERALLFTLSGDDGQTWSEQVVIGPVDGKHLGAVRHNVLPWTKDRWLLPLRVGRPLIFDPKRGELEFFPLISPDGMRHEFQQIVRTADGSLLAMGPVLLRSTDEGESWSEIDFPITSDARDNLEGRFLTPLKDGGVLVTWGVGHENLGLRFNHSPDNGKSWTREPVTLLPETPIAARYYSARTIQTDDEHVGVVFMNKRGVFFLKVKIEELRG